jgi:phytoene dehydrogenase-like protein
VLADVSAPALYRELVGDAHLPRRLRADLERFQWDPATVKVDWSLDGPIPWEHPDARRAGTVHVADGVGALAVHATQLANGELPSDPFLLVGQYAAYDETRQPPGKETAWAYTHVPHGLPWNAERTGAFADRIEGMVERVAPGFRARIRRRHVLAPGDLEGRDRNLHEGALNGGTAQLHQQLVFRPTPGLGRPETPLRGLYLASASAHPGGGVHGACGANAAKAALLHARLRAPLRARTRRGA